MKVQYVSRSTMIDETGMDALGYTQPHKERILIQKGLDKDTEHEVRKHEWEHAKKGEEGPFWGAIIGSVIGALGAKSAADTQAGAINKATTLEEQKALEEQRRYQEMQPFREAQVGAARDIAGLESGTIDPQAALEQDPGYKFRMQQGQTAFDRMLAARGFRLGGRGIKAAINYGQGVGTQEYGNLMNRKYRLAGLNAPAPVPVPQNQVGNLAIQGGGVQAQYAQNMNDIIQGGLKNYQTYKTYNDWSKSGVRPMGGVSWSTGYGGE